MAQSKGISPKTIINQYENWVKLMKQSNERAKECIAFVEEGRQWDADIRALRQDARKETLVFNVLLKHLHGVQAKGKNLELTIDLAPTKDNNDPEQTNTFKMVLHDAMLGTQQKESFKRGLDKTYSYGYAVYIAKAQYENKSENLNKRPVILCLEDPSMAFFDPYAPSLTKHDGNYCGIAMEIGKSEFLRYYPEYAQKNPDFLKQKKNLVIDYWFKEWENMKFVRLATGVYKREDLLTDEDKEILSTGDHADICKYENVCKVMSMRIINDKVLEKPTEYPSEDILPMAYEYGLTRWTTGGYQAYPFAYPLMDAQRLHNFLGSNLATISKNSTGDKWLFTPEHIQSEEQKQAAKDINKRDGGFIFAKDSEGKEIRREMPGEIPPTVIEFWQLSKQEIDDIAGAFATAQGAEVKAIAGVALDKLFNRIDVLQNNVIQSHIHTIDVMAMIVRKMIPNLYTENRTLIVATPDNSQQAIEINKVLSTGTIKNNIKDIQNNYHYSIKAAVSTEVQQQNTQESLERIYAINPQLMSLTIDRYFANLDIPEAELLARRAVLMVDPIAVKYANGEISLSDAMNSKQAMMMQQMQAQANSPQGQLANAKTQLEQAKAAKIQHEIQNLQPIQPPSMTTQADEQRNNIDLLKIQQQAYDSQKDRQLEYAKLGVQHLHNMLGLASSQNNGNNAQ